MLASRPSGRPLGFHKLAGHPSGFQILGVAAGGSEPPASPVLLSRCSRIFFSSAALQLVASTTTFGMSVKQCAIHVLCCVNESLVCQWEVKLGENKNPGTSMTGHQFRCSEQHSMKATCGSLSHASLWAQPTHAIKSGRQSFIGYNKYKAILILFIVSSW